MYNWNRPGGTTKISFAIPGRIWIICHGTIICVRLPRNYSSIPRFYPMRRSLTKCGSSIPSTKRKYQTTGAYCYRPITKGLSYVKSTMGRVTHYLQGRSMRERMGPPQRHGKPTRKQDLIPPVGTVSPRPGWKSHHHNTLPGTHNSNIPKINWFIKKRIIRISVVPAM